MRNRVRAGIMMRIRTAAIWVAFAGMVLSQGAVAQVQTAPSATRLAQAAPPPEAPTQRQRPPRRLPVYPRRQLEPDDVYPRYDPGPNAVRDCNVAYVEEHRPSGTVIVPHMHCVWRPG
jgi:hypothetical protein